METIKGKIEGILMNQGETAGKSWKRYVFTINSKKYSTFDEDIGKEFKIGDYVEMTGEQKGLYWNMKTMKKCTDEAPKEEIKVSQEETILRQILAELKSISSILHKDE